MEKSLGDKIGELSVVDSRKHFFQILEDNAFDFVKPKKYFQLSPLETPLLGTYL